MDKCPYCNSNSGVYTTFTGKQYYDWNGEPCGYNTNVSENQSKFARCINCNRKISIKNIKNSEEN